MACFLLLCLAHLGVIAAANTADVQIDAPKVLLTNVEFDVKVTGLPDRSAVALHIDNRIVAESSGSSVSVEGIKTQTHGETRVEVFVNGKIVAEKTVATVPGWASILPPLIAILLAFALRAVIPALFAGLLVGAWSVNGMTWSGAWSGFFETLTIYVVGAAVNPDRMAIMVFTLMIGGMVGIISRNGGMVGIVQRIMPFAKTPRRGQGVVAVLGLGIFFDDYANTMIVGNATRPMSDKLNISREKLAYLVDSTAAPVATVAVITTWIGFQVGLIDAAVKGLDGITQSPYLLFLNSIPYSFYPFLAIFMVFLVVYTRRDFGPMYHAELRARQGGVTGQSTSPADDDTPVDEFFEKDGIACHAMNAVLPILTMVVTVLFGLFISGDGDNITDIIGSANSFEVLMWASLLGCLMAIALSLGQRILTLDEAVHAWMAGARFMLTGLVLLVLAWAVADVAGILQTAPYLISILGDSLSPSTFPAVIFLLAALTAFATGSSWGVMAILMPLVIPLCWAVMQGHGVADADHMYILYSSIACVMTGAVWADHCSPISDTTVLSSIATGCDHMNHVRTQLPYAMLGGVVAVLFGVLPAGYGLPWYLLMPAGAAAMLVVHRFLGKETEQSALG